MSSDRQIGLDDLTVKSMLFAAWGDGFMGGSRPGETVTFQTREGKLAILQPSALDCTLRSWRQPGLADEDASL